MNSIILCEGKTDAILISYYLERTNQWSHYKKRPPVKIPMQNPDNEEVNWYELNNDLLAIWGVGGKSNFNYAINEILKINKFGNSNQFFTKVVAISDRDNDTEDNKLQEFSGYFSSCGQINLVNKEWILINTVDEYHAPIQFQVASLIVPFDRPGALETFLLKAISCIDDDHDHIVNVTHQFINEINSAKFLFNDRQKLKAEFAATLAIMYPEKTFTLMNNLLTGIPWEQYKEIQNGFQILETI